MSSTIPSSKSLKSCLGEDYLEDLKSENLIIFRHKCDWGRITIADNLNSRDSYSQTSSLGKSVHSGKEERTKYAKLNT